jgi:hypothetical protein
VKSSKRHSLARRIAEQAHEAELTAIYDKIRAREDQLAEMSDIEFAQAVREYAEKLVAETTAS